MQVKKTPYCIEVDHVSFYYGEELVLKDVTFTIEEGDYVGIIGPNGGGKTTLLNIILGLLRPSSGSIKIFGQDVAVFQDHFTIGYVPQRILQGDIPFPATVEEIVQTGRTARLGLFHNLTNGDKRAIREAMEVAGVFPQRDRLIGKLSGGERQRVLIARALAAEPKILLLDEPTIGVDVPSQEKFYTFLRNLNHERGITVIFVSHDIDVVAHEVSTLVCLNRRLICHGSPKEYMKEQYLQELYGKKLSFILHGH